MQNFRISALRRNTGIGDSWQRSVLLPWQLAMMIVPALGVRMTCRHVLHKNRFGPTDILNRLPWNRKPTQ